jgi:membrane associated rhomboid family serine protease
MIPVGDNIKASNAPVVNWLLIIANFVAFFVELSQGEALQEFLHRFALVPAFLTGLASPPPDALPPVLTIFTSMFLHGGWGHILGNMLFLWVFGDNVEDVMGSRRYLAFYLLCGFVASMGQVYAMPDAAVPNIGASGAVSGVLGAYIVLYPRAVVTMVVPLFIFFPIVHVPAWLMLGFWFLTQFTSGLASMARTLQTGGVAFWAHVGGFVAGIILVFLFRRRQPERRQAVVYR